MPKFESQKTYALFATPANKKFIVEIESCGAQIFLFPMVETNAIELNAEAENLLENISAFDWIIFPDVFAVDYFLHALEKLEIDLFELDALRVCAFSETVADRLRFSQIHADVISNTAETEKVLHALQDYEPEFDKFRFLIPKEKDSNPDFVNQLNQLGASVSELQVYRAETNKIVELAKLKALLNGGAIDEFIFSSPEEAANFSLLFQTNNFSPLLSDISVITTNSRAFSSLREFGLSRILLHQ